MEIEPQSSGGAGEGENARAAEGDGVEGLGRIEIIISRLLLIGVGVSIALVAAGTVLSFVRHPEYENSGQVLGRLTSHQAVFPDSLAGVVAGLRHLQGRAIVVLGLLCLIATPVLRVGVSIFAFAAARDMIFVVLTSIVLGLLILSFFLGGAG